MDEKLINSDLNCAATNRFAKEDYITPENIGQKSIGWMSEISPLVSWHRSEKFNFKPRNSALLVIDMQRYFLDPASHAFLPAAPVILPNIVKMIELYRKRKLTVIFTYFSIAENEDPGIMERWWGDLLHDGDDMAQIVGELKPDDGEQVIGKSKYSSFAGTDLDKILKENNIEQLLITGVMTHLCCETTARDAFMHGYEVYFAIDATATGCEQLHLSSLMTLSSGFAMPVLAKDVLNCLR